jgi:hypothetical protein
MEAAFSVIVLYAGVSARLPRRKVAEISLKTVVQCDADLPVPALLCRHLIKSVSNPPQGT